MLHIVPVIGAVLCFGCAAHGIGGDWSLMATAHLASSWRQQVSVTRTAHNGPSEPCRRYRRVLRQLMIATAPLWRNGQRVRRARGKDGSGKLEWLMTACSQVVRARNSPAVLFCDDVGGRRWWNLMYTSAVHRVCRN